MKFVSSQSTNNMFEGVYNFDGILLTAENDPVNCGTYNYCSDQINSELHQKFDVKTYKVYGNVKGYKYPGNGEKRGNKSRYLGSIIAKNNREYFESTGFFILQ